MANYVKVTGAETGKVYNVPAEDFAGSYDDYVKNSAGAKVEMYDMDGNKKSVDIADARDMYGKGYTYWQGQPNHYAGKIRYAEARKKAAEEEARDKEPASVAAEARKVVRASMPDKKSTNTPSAVPSTKSETPTAEPATEETEATQKSAPTATTQSKEPEPQPLTEAEKMQMMYGTGMQQIAQTVGDTQRTINKIKQQTKKANRPLDADRKIKLGENRKTITETTFNPQTGKQETSYIDEFGNEHANRAEADLVGNIVDQHNSEQYNIDAELRDAEAELARLNEEKSAAREARGKTIGVTMNTPGAIMTRDETRYSLEDRAYDAAIRQTEQRIKDIKEERDSRNGEDVGFWRAFGRVTGDTRTWDFGVGDARDATTMLQLQGENELTDSEKKARGVLMEQLYKAQQTEQKYGGNRDFWYRAGVTTGYMPAFMLDFAAAELTGGGSAAIKAGAKTAAKVATKAIGKQAVEEIAKLGLKQYIKSEGKRGIGKYAANWAIKALGTTADELLVRAPLMTNTIQANKTYADVVGRKLGDVTRDENGNFSFENSKSWGDAVWQGEANAIIENYSEMFGTHLDPVLSLKNAQRVANALGAGRISAMISKASNAGLQSAMGQTQKLFEKLGVSDYFGEVSEEYYGQLWRTMLNLDDAYIDNGDGTRTNNFLNAQFHGDILGGMALSMGMIGGVKAGFNAANYGRLKKNLRNYEAEARTLLGDDEWEVIKSGIQGCTNEDIGKLIASIYESEDYTDEDKRAILRYTEGSLRLRGYDMADLKQKEQETQRQQWEQPNEELATEAGQTIATEAAPLSEQPNPQVVIDESQEYRDAQSALAEAENKMRTELPSLDIDGLLEGVDLASVSTEQLTELLPSLPPKVRDAVVEYVSARNVANNAAARHQAVLDGISGQIDEAVDNYYDANVSNNDEGAADVVVYNDENGQSWYVRSGLYGESVLLMDENGNVKWMPSSDIDSSRLVLYDKETQMEGLRTYLQERITQEYGLGEQEQAETEGGVEPTQTPTEAVEPTQTETTTQTETQTPTEAVQTEEAVQHEETSAQTEETAQRPEIPTDKDGNKLYFENQVEPSVAVDDILADLDDDMGVADEAVGQELAAARKGLQKVSNEKANGIAGQKAKKAKIRIAQGAVDYWQSVADEITKRKLAARQEKEAALAAEAAALQQANEAEGQVPEWRHDTPESARQRGYRVSEGERYDRQGNIDGIVGRESKAVFTNKDGDTKTGNLMLVDINSVQESHRGDGKNPYHFIPEAQPKDRTSSASRTDTAVNAKPDNFKPELLTGDGVVYNESAPIINARGEVIQGNGRVMTLRDVYKNPESAAAYKAYLKEHAAEFGLTPEDVDKMENPILVNRIDVDDNEAIRLGQFKATDLESGGSQRIEPRETIRKMGDWFGNFVNQMFSGDEETSVAQLIDANGVKVLKYMNAKGIISNTQMETAVKDGELTAEGKNDLMRLLKHKLFEDAPTELETMFQELPVKAQKAILATYLRDNEVPVESGITNDIRASIMAFHELMQMENFKDATTYEGAKKAISDWLRQQNMFESVANKDKFSTFALELAAREKVLSQKAMTELLNTYYDMVSERTGVAGDLFNEADNNVYTKAEAVKKLFNVDLNENKKDNGNGLQGSDALAGDGGPRGEGRQGSSGDAASGKQDASGAKPSDSRRGAGRDGAEGTEDIKEVVEETNDDKPNSVGYTPKQIREHQVLVDKRKADYIQALKDGKTGKELENVEGLYEDTFKDHQNMLGILDEASVDDLWKHELKNAKKAAKGDNQGNPVNADGSLLLDKVNSVDELTDEDFLNPSRNVQLPALPQKVADAIGVDDKPVIIKKNIFERNHLRHEDVTPEQSKAIFNAALYNPGLYGQNQKAKRPYNWVLINTKDENGKNRMVLLEVNPNKDNVEIVHWHFVNDKNLELIKKQAIREGDQILILPSENSEEVGGLSNLTDDLLAAKLGNNSETAKENGEKLSGAERRRARRGFRDIMPRKTPEEVFAEWQKKASGWVTEGSQYAADSKEAVVSSETWQEAYDKLRKKAEEYRAKADEWRKKVYKKHDGSVEVGGKYNDLDATNVRIDYINERRRENAIRNLEGDAKHFEELAERLKTEATKYEIPSAPAKKEDKPWSEMNGEERLAAAEKNPLTEEEIREKTSEENADLIEDAVDYLNGNRGFTQQIAYLKIFDDVRNRHEDAADNSGAKDGTQLAASDNGGGEGMGLGTGRDGRGTAEQLDKGTGSETAPEERERGEGSTDNAGSSAGERSDKQGEGTAPELGAVPPGSADTARGGRVGTDGGTSKRSGRKGSSGSAKSDAKRKPAAKQGTTWRGRTDAEIKREAKDAKAGLKAALAEMAKRGRGQLSLSLVGLNQAQIEYVPELMKAVKRYGVSLIDQGIYKMKEWMGNVRDAIHDDMSDMGFSDKDIDEFIEEMWNSKMPMDGEVHTIAEWSSIYEKSQLREKLKETLTDKRELQKAAESIAVKIGDMKNIEETLPFLLPQQQEDVYRAEVQLFGADHADRDHAYGKGYLFTNGTGTGKTYTGLGIAKRFAKQGKGRILFLTPSQQKVSDWIKDGYNLGLDIKDLDKVAKEKGTTATNESGDGMVITTYANMRQNKKLLETEWDAVIYDESHRILENKKGTQTTGSQQHYMLTNRDEEHCFARLRMTNPAYKKMQLAADLFDEAREKEIARIKKEYEENHPDTAERDVLVAVGKLAPKSLGEFTPADAAQFPSLAKLYKNYSEASQHYLKDVEPKLKEQAKNTWKNTKTVFLSATPFNTRENLGYAEGYIFKFPEEEKGGRMTGRTRFYLDNFGAAYSFRYGRLEAKTNNPEAVAKQEIAFSDYMQNELGTMSGRIIDSPYDYSRDFPIVAPDKAEEFNAAVQSAVRSRHLCGAYFKSIGEYNYGSALFETMKVATSVQRIKEHLDAGRKVVIFHRRVETKEPITPPFEYMLQVANEEIAHMRPGKDRNEYIQEAKNFRNTYGDLLQWEQTLDYSMPRAQLAKVFGADNVLFFSGKESKSVKSKAVDTFNDDNSGKNIIVIQEASGKEGISLHDTTGEHQRVCITLALPQSPITALQIEGRIYRIGNKSNAIFEYPLLGLNSEMMLFGQKFNAQVSTTENLALGSQARNLRDSFARGVLEHSGIVPIEQQGVGGKEFDAPKGESDDPYGDAVLDYYSNQKLNKRNREGVDYFPTPEPLGYKMVEWANLGEGDTVLEPSAGHGAIARYVPQSNPLLSIEPSQSLFAKLQLKAGGLGRKFLNDTFENFDIKNKRDAVVMNPPFGTAGATAIAHVDKAYKHLDEGGRLVALIPRGAMDKKFEKWYNEQNNAVLRAEVDLPSILFEQAGTNVRCRVVVVDKITDSAMRGKAGYPEKIDLSGNYTKIEDFFDDLRDVELPERIVDAKLKAMKKARSFKKDLEEIRGIEIEYLDRDNISVWDKHSRHYYTIAFRDSNKDEATIFYANKYNDFDNRQNIVYDESSKEALGVMKKIACKLADMSEDEMLRYIESKPRGVLYRTGEESEKSVREEGAAETKQSVEALQREQLERKRAYAQSVIDNYGGKGRVVADASELDETGKRALRENKRMTGYYDPKTGEVVVYLPNCSSQVEVERTVLHEKVGHEGLRGLLGGREQHKKFLQKIYLGMSKETRSEINARMQRNGWSLYEAMDEYLAEAAETFTGENRSLWQKIKDVWNDTMRSLGFKQGSTEADIRTALWLSANRLRENESSLEYKLRRAAFNSALKRYHPTEATSRNGYTWGDEHKVDEDGDFIPDLLYRTSRMSDEDRDAATRNLTPEGRDCLRRYNERLANWKYAWREAHYDRLASVRDMLDVILHPKKGEKIASKYDIASKMEALGSKNQQEQEKFQREHANPLLRKIGELQTYFSGKTPGERYRQFEAYMYVKHALERNRTLFVRDAIKAMTASEDPVLQAKSATAQQEYDAERNRLLGELDKGNIDLREFYTQLDGWINTNISKFDAAKHDMSGLSDVDSALMKSLGISIGKKGAYNEDAALDFVLNSESRMGRNNVDEVWSMVNAISHGNVEREYNAGLMNQKARDRMNSMFAWYLPLRGFDAKTSDEVYGYIGEGDMHGFTSNPKTKGRTSTAETPISTLLAMSDYSIFRSNKNQMKYSLVMLARDHQNDLVTEYETWYHETVDANGNKVLEPSYPDLREGMTAAEITQAIEDHEDAIRQKKDAGETWVKLKDEKTNSPYRIVSPKQRNQHIVSCMIDGKKVDILIHGNPRAAQAINGMVHDTHWAIWDNANHALSQLMTSYSLSFMGRNKLRDMEYALASGLTENVKMGERWNRNFAKIYAQLDFLNPSSRTVGDRQDANGNRVKMQDKVQSALKLFSLYRQGKLDMNNEIHRYFSEFVSNGGMTGYTQMHAREEFETQIHKTLAEHFDKQSGNKAVRFAQMSGKEAAKFFESYFDAVEKINEAIENQTRFAAYCASRMERRSVTRAIADAKDISINFNRTGAGWATHSLRVGNEGMGWKLNRDAAALTATYMRHSQWFYNAAIQGMVRNIKLFKDGDTTQRARFVASMVLTPMLLAAVSRMSGMLVAAMMDGDDDKKKYGASPLEQLPDFVRRQNFCMYLGHGRFALIPLSVELRAPYGLMDVCERAMFGIPSEKGYGAEMFEQLTQLTPYDLGGGSKVGSNDWIGSAAGVVTPSNLQGIIACATNVKWTGGPVSGRSDYNASEAEWQRGLPTTSPFFVQGARFMSTDFSNALADAADKMGLHDTATSWRGDPKGVKGGLVDINPAWAQYLVETYLGGPGKDWGEYGAYAANKVSDVKEYGWGSLIGKEGAADLTRTPIVKAFTRSATPTNAMAANRSRWYTYNKEYNDETKPWLKGMTKHGETVDAKLLKHSKKGKIGAVVAAYSPIVKEIQARKNAAKTNTEREYMQWQMNDYINKAIAAIDEIEKQ